MTSTLTLYKNCQLTPEHNYILDSVQNYLLGLQPLVINNFQHIKHGLDLSIKVDLPQTEVSQPTYNYASIKNEDDSKTFYYFITNVEWKAQNTVNLTLSIDSLTTFNSKFVTANWDSRTKIIREHQDRFVNTGVSSTDSFNALRKIDHEDEGLSGVNTYKYFKEKIISDGESKTTNPDPTKTYLIYATDNNNVVSCYITSNNDFRIYGGTENSRIKPTEDLDINTVFVFTNIPGQTSFNVSPSYASERVVECSSTYSYVLLYCTDTNATPQNGWHMYRMNGSTYEPSQRLDFLSGEDYISFFQSTTWLVEAIPAMSGNQNITSRLSNSVLVRIGSSEWPRIISPLYDIPAYVMHTNGGSYSIPIRGLNDWNLTDSRLIKIIDCPYWLGGPISQVLSTGKWTFISSDFGKDNSRILCLKLNTNIVNTELYNLIKDNYALDYFNVIIPNKENRYRNSKNKNYESKMYHSSIFKNTYAYDSFVYEIRPEDLTTTVNPTLDINYVQSSNISSRCLFDFKLNPNTYKEYTNFENILSCDRNNEYPIYNSEYLNYIKNGYNYDKKAKDTQNIGNWIGTGLQIAGAVASFAASTVTGGVSAAAGISLITSATASIANNIITDVNNERSINQKLAELKNKSASVSTSDDLSLLNYYCDNKLWRFDYKPSTKVENSIYDLFYRTGYAFNSTGVPDRQSRRSFNYVQCEPIFKDENSSDWSIYLDDVKQRFKAGVTIMHRFQIEENGDYIYDFNFNYENWETFICPRSY